jgi:hypothetical protein
MERALARAEMEKTNEAKQSASVSCLFGGKHCELCVVIFC